MYVRKKDLEKDIDNQKTEIRTKNEKIVFLEHELSQ